MRPHIKKLPEVVILVFFLSGCQAGDLTKKESKLIKGPTGTQGRIPTSGFLEETFARNKVECAKTCTMNENCVSMYYLTDTRACKIHNQTMTAVPGDQMALNSAAVYYVMYTNEATPCPSDESIFQPAQTSDGEIFEFRVFMDTARTFSEAEILCSDHGAKLYKVLTERKMAFTEKLNACPAYAGAEFWANCLNNGGTWMTQDGEAVPLTSTIWDPLPNGPPGECVRIRLLRGLDDAVCGSLLYTICEKI